MVAMTICANQPLLPHFLFVDLFFQHVNKFLLVTRHTHSTKKLFIICKFVNIWNSRKRIFTKFIIYLYSQSFFYFKYDTILLLLTSVYYIPLILIFCYVNHPVEVTYVLYRSSCKMHYYIFFIIVNVYSYTCVFLYII